MYSVGTGILAKCKADADLSLPISENILVIRAKARDDNLGANVCMFCGHD